MADVDVATGLEALRYLRDAAVSSFNTTLGFYIVAIGWLITSSRARDAISTRPRTRAVLLAVIAVGWALNIARLWILHDRSTDLARKIPADPTVIAAYKVSTWDTIGNTVVATLLAGTLFYLAFHPSAEMKADE